MLISFICTGNICRSPSAAIIARHALAQAQLQDVEVTSAGTSAYHIGEPINPYAAQALTAHGYNTDHSARQLGDLEHKADLVIVATKAHQRQVIERGVDPAKVRLLRSFDDYADDNELADPYYSGYDAFEEMVAQIESAMPGIITWIIEHRNSLTDSESLASPRQFSTDINK